MNRFSEQVGGLFKRYRKRGAIALAVLVAVELIAAAAIVLAGRELIGSGSAPPKPDRGGTPALGFSSAHSAPSIAVF